MIKIITGPIKSGKTTRLTAWVKCHQNCVGILSPVINNQRFIYSILEDEYRPLETEEDDAKDPKTITIGRYTFQESTFEWAREQLTIADAKNRDWLIIDEIGPLELSGIGLEPQVGKIIDSTLKSGKDDLILVVREGIVDKVVDHYHLHGNFQTTYNLEIDS